jgi:hypothetical protein
MPKPITIPHGSSHKTPAGQNLIRLATGGTKGTHRKKKKAAGVSAPAHKKRKKTAAATTSKKRRKTGKGHLVKGSAAAKKYMASIRAKRKTG